MIIFVWHLNIMIVNFNHSIIFKFKLVILNLIFSINFISLLIINNLLNFIKLSWKKYRFARIICIKTSFEKNTIHSITRDKSF